MQKLPKTKMKHFTKLLLLILSLYTNICYCQVQQEGSYLYNVGITDSIYSKNLSEYREYWVHLPNNYSPNNKIEYPVLFVLDGGVHLNGVASILSYQTPAYMPEMIVVGIANYQNRTRDLTPSEVKMRRGFRVRESGGAEIFTNFLKNELIPLIDEKYKTTNYRTIIGHSYGGLYVINTLVNHSELFANYIAIDPAPNGVT